MFPHISGLKLQNKMHISITIMKEKYASMSVKSADIHHILHIYRITKLKYVDKMKSEEAYFACTLQAREQHLNESMRL